MTARPTPPRQVLLVSSSSGSHGGGELYLDGLAEGLTSLGHSVRTLMAAHSRMDPLAKTLEQWGPVARLEYRNMYDRRTRSLGAVLGRSTIRSLGAAMAASTCDVIHLNRQNLEDGLDLTLAAARTHIPSVATVHVTRGMQSLGAVAGRWRDCLARSVGRKFNGEYIAVAKTGVEQFLQFAGGSIPAASVHAVWNGVRSASLGDRESIRREWNVAPEVIVLGCVARIEDQKDPLFALDVLAKLPSHVHLAWIGDGRLRGDFEAKVRSLGLAERVHLDGWRTDAKERMAGFDVFVLPSKYEGFPFAVLEAMMAGLSTVVSDVDGTREAVIEGQTGHLCPSHDLERWTSCLRDLVETPGRRRAMGSAAKARAEEHFSLTAMARGTAAVYEIAIARARAVS